MTSPPDVYRDYYDRQVGEPLALIAKDEQHWAGFFRRRLHPLAAQRVLDVGCGPGGLLRFLSAENALVGLELSRSAAEAARMNGVSIVQADVQAPFPFPDAVFDLVVCREVFEHLFAPLSALREIRRVLKPDGRLIGTAPNHFSLYRRLGILLGQDLVSSAQEWFPAEATAWDSPHIRYFTRRAFSRFLRAGGFREVADWSQGVQVVVPLLRKRVKLGGRLARRTPDLLCDGYVALCVKEPAWSPEASTIAGAEPDGG